MSGEILCDKEIRKLIDQGAISGASHEFVAPGSLDLRVDHPGFRLLGSVKPLRGKTVEETLEETGVVDSQIADQEDVTLERMQPYLFRLLESLNLPQGISARVFNKSGRGRVGVSVKSLCNGVDRFDHVPGGYEGFLWAEVCPTTFPISLIPGETLMPQIRFYYGDPSPLKGPDLELLMRKEPLLLNGRNKPIKPTRSEMAEINRTGALTFTADLSKGLVAYKATRDNRVIDLGREKFYKPEDFFESVKRSRDEGKGKLIHPDDFLLIMSREKIRLPPTHAAEIAECDPTLGDWKIHYAGLINPGHGYKHRKMCGDHIVFEVRARDFPNFLQHGQPIAKFHVYEMSDVPEQKYAGIKSTGFEDLASILPVQFKKTG